MSIEQTYDRSIQRRLGAIEHKLDAALSLLLALIAKETIMAATIDQVLQDVTDESTLDDSIIALLNGVQAQLAAALSGTTIPPAVQTKIDAVFSGLEANKAKVAAAVTANTPAAP